MVFVLEELSHTVLIIRRGNYYGCISDIRGNIIKKGFPTRDEARDWAMSKVDAYCSWTE